MGQNSKTEEGLWEEFKAGSRQAFTIIYRKHIDALFSYGLKIHDSRDLVEDCIHDLFVDLWRRKDFLGATTNIKFYLFKGLRRKILNALAKTPPAGHKEHLEKSMLETILSFEETLISEESKQAQKDCLQKALSNLSPKQREIIYLKFYDGLSYEEIAEILSINYQSVRNTIYQAMTKLRKYLLTGFLIFLSFF